MLQGSRELPELGVLARTNTGKQLKIQQRTSTLKKAKLQKRIHSFRPRIRIQVPGRYLNQPKIIFFYQGFKR